MPYLNGRRVASVERFTEMSFSDQQTSIPSELSTPIDNLKMLAPSSSMIQPPSQSSSVTPTRSIIKAPNRYQNTPQNPQQYRQPNTPDKQYRASNDPIYRSTVDPRGQELVSLNGQKNGDRLADVYSNSDDTVQFAGNLRSFINNNVPFMVWIGLAVVEIVVGLVSIFFGAYNYSMCEIQPLMPLYLILSGTALIFHGLVRSAKSFPSPKRRRTARNRPKKSSLYPDLLMHGLEGIALLYILICVVLGCVWVYGSRSRYVQYIPNMFEQDYCDQTLYWVAWWSVTLHLVVFGLLILAVIFILIYGSMIKS